MGCREFRAVAHKLVVGEFEVAQRRAVEAEFVALVVELPDTVEKLVVHHDLILSL